MMEEEKKSRKGCFIALGVVGVIVIVALIGIFIVFQKVKDIGTDYLAAFGVSPEMIEQVQDLNREYPFEQPADGAISEDQIIRFISIKRNFADRIKEQEKEFQKLEEAKDQGESGFKEFRQALSILSEIRSDFLKALEENEMSPREYQYLSYRIYSAYLGVAMQGTEGETELRGEISEENVELLNKYQDELKELNTYGFEFWGMTMWGGTE